MDIAAIMHMDNQRAMLSNIMHHLHKDILSGGLAHVMLRLRLGSRHGRLGVIMSRFFRLSSKAASAVIASFCSAEGPTKLKACCVLMPIATIGPDSTCTLSLRSLCRCQLHAICYSCPALQLSPQSARETCAHSRQGNIGSLLTCR